MPKRCICATPISQALTHYGWVKYICEVNLTIIGSDNGLSPVRRQAIIWTTTGIFLILPSGKNFHEILIKKSYIFIKENTFENVVWKLHNITCMHYWFRFGAQIAKYWTFWGPTGNKWTILLIIFTWNLENQLSWKSMKILIVAVEKLYWHMFCLVVFFCFVLFFWVFFPYIIEDISS